MHKRSKLTVMLPKEVLEKLRADARRTGRTLNTVAETIFVDFLKGWSAGERSNFYRTMPAKKAGRPFTEEESKP